MAFPAPLVLADGAWSFDAEEAREEVLARRIGQNELAAIAILRGVGTIQANCGQTDHDGNGAMEFAASILSSPGARDGLYGPDQPGVAPRPSDDTNARLNFSGFSVDDEDRETEPPDDCYFRIPQGRGASAPGGAYSNMIGGQMVAGHALAVYPAISGDTGIMSVMVAENGVVYEVNLGADRLSSALKIEGFDRGEEWFAVE